MKIKMKTSIAGHGDGKAHKTDFSYQPGDTPDLPDELAKAWIASGKADEVKDDEKKK